MSPDINNEVGRKKEVSYTEFKEAWAPFAHDLEIVGEQERLHPRSPFAAPLDNFDAHGHHNYNLTIWEGTEEEIQDHLSQIKVVVVGCMDWRFAKALYDQALDKGFKPEEIMFITVGGGMVQYGEGRENGLETILDYVLGNAKEVTTVIATGHADRCGAVASWTDAPPGQIHEHLGPHAGSPEEISNMSGFIIQGIKDHLTIPPGRTVKVEPELLKLTKPIKEGDRTVSVEIIPLSMDQEGRDLSAVIP